MNTERTVVPSENTGARCALIGATLRCEGTWTARHLGAIETFLSEIRWPDAAHLEFDLAAISRIDTAGAWLLYRALDALRQTGRSVAINGLSAKGHALLELVQQSSALGRSPPRPPSAGFLENTGRSARVNLRETAQMLEFLGATGLAAIRLVLRRGRFRWRATLDELANAGHRALAMVGLLSFLVGVVIAYQGGVQLRLYGASIFIADIVSLSMLRELAPLITAIVMAGRTGSAYTAAIGTMKVTEEIDALRAMGVSPLEVLVLPKLLALMISLPLLVVFADIVGVAGGMVMASAMLDVGPIAFAERLEGAVSPDAFLIGVGKAPVFAAIIAVIGCYHGLQVRGSAESVGRRTTVSVVQGIIAVIVVDAAFSVIFSKLGI